MIRASRMAERAVVTSAFAELAELLLAASHELEPLLDAFARLMLEAIGGGGKIISFGCGGSAAAAQHFAAELVGRYASARPGIAGCALGVDACVSSAIANDFGFDQVFSRQLEALANPGDVVVALTTSGRSPSVLNALRSARLRGCRIVVLTGANHAIDPGAEALRIAVPSSDTARIQEVHLVCLHTAVARLERLLPSRATS